MVKKSKTPTFLLELPLKVNSGQAGRLRAHLEEAYCLYNTLLGEALKRMQRMKADPRWQVARAIPRSQKQERRAAFSRLREDYEFSENALHAFTRNKNFSPSGGKSVRLYLKGYGENPRYLNA